MDSLLTPKAGASSSSAPARTADVVPNRSSAARKRPTAAAKGRQPAAKGKQPAAKKTKLSDLERLTGRQESSGKKTGLSLALQNKLLAGLSSNNRRALVPQQRNTENNTPTAQEDRTSAAAQRKSGTDRLKKRNRLAAAASETAQKAGWFDIPGVSKAPPTSAAPAAAATPSTATAVAAPPPRRLPRQLGVSALMPKRVAVKAAPSRRTEAATTSRKYTPGSAASAPAAPPPVSERAAPLSRIIAPLPSPQTLPPATASATLPKERPAAARQPKVRSRAGRMDEFFPRRVLAPSATPPPAPAIPVQRQPSSSLRGAWASQYARPPAARRYAKLRSRDYSDGGGSADSDDVCENGCDYDCECEATWDPDADHLRWRGDSDDEEEEDEEGARGVINGGAARSLISTGGDRRSGAEPGTRAAAAAPAGPGVVSTANPASSSASARPTARSETAARAAAAAERRAAMSATATAGPGEGHDPVAARTEEAALDGAASRAVEADAELEAADQAVAVPGAIGAEAAAAASSASSGGAPVADDSETPSEATDAHAAAWEAPAAAAPWPCRRKRGSASLFLSQRQRTGGLRRPGVGVGDAGRDTFRRQALSKVLAHGLRTQRLRLGRTSNSRVAAGVARGLPESQGIHGRVAGGVTCMEFDSEGWCLAVAGENVTVYDFDQYLPKNLQLKHTLVAGARAYLQPLDCIQTKRTVSCVRWNPSDEEQLAVSYLHSDEVEVYDLTRVKQDGSVAPVKTLVPSSSSLNGNSGGRGHLCLEFVRRAGPSGSKLVTHLVAGGRDGVFRVWRLATERASKIAPYLQGQLSASLKGALFSRSHVTAVCCLNPDAVLVGTSSGLLAAYSLNPPVPKPFRSAKDADMIAGWSLHETPEWGLGLDDDFDAAPRDPAGFAVQFVRLSLDHGAGVVLCGLRSGRVVVFDTTHGRALGITEPLRGTASIGFCLPPAAGAYVRAAATTTDGAPLTEGEGETLPYGGLPPAAGAYVRAAATTTDGAPLTEGEGGTLPYGGGHWGPAVLACCKSTSGVAGEELVVLATSARAALDSGKRRQDRGTTRSPRKSGMRPGPGWEVGEVGGGGFRVEESEGYDLCLPVEVVAATPGRSRVQLSKDVRGYLCPRDQGRLLRSRLVTSSIMIGKEKHSVEAVNADGTELILDRKYRGPAVVKPPRVREDEGGGAGVEGATSQRHGPPSNVGGSGSGGSSSGSGSGGAGEDVEAVDDSSEVDDPEPVGGADDGADDGSQSRTSPPPPPSATATAGAVPTPVSGQESAAAAGEGDAGGSDQPWNRAWRPNGVRIFAKLRAIFGDRQEQYEDEEAVFGARQRGSGEKKKAPPTPFALFDVVARAGLSLQETAVTAIASHPRNNFVLVGLKDGTVAAVLPEGKRERSR